MDRVAQIWHELYEMGGKDRIRELLELDPNQAKATQHGTSLLHIAAGAGYSDEVLLLLNAGADVNSSDECGDTPLHNAACGSHPKTCHILLDQGASTEITNRRGEKPIDCARRGNVWAWEEDFNQTISVIEEFSEKA
jgi:hypothetical protein